MLTVLHYCKLTSVLPTQKSYTDVRYGEILLFMVKPAELILLMLSDLFWNAFTFLRVCSETICWSCLPLTTPKIHSMNQETIACIQEQEHACEEVCWLSKRAYCWLSWVQMLWICMADLLDTAPLHRVGSDTAVTPCPEGEWKWRERACKSMLEWGFWISQMLSPCQLFPLLGCKSSISDQS